MLSLKNVTKNFQLDEHTTITPVKNATLDIGPGEFIVIIGRSGTGKTTLLNLAAGLVKPSSGKVMMDGVNLSDMTDQQLSAMRTNTLGFVFQFPSLLSSLTVLENITMPSLFVSNNGKQETARKAMEILKLMKISDKINVYPRQLSAGEQKRVVISRSLINDPKIVLADEPTSDLDVNTEKEVMGMLKEANSRGVSFLMVTHSLQLLPFATKAFEMNNGILTDITRQKGKVPVQALKNQ
jgi:ABC-type lipoprotein export system ATPase subunit